MQPNIQIYMYIFTMVLFFLSLNHVNIFYEIPDEHSHKVVHQFAKSHAQWFKSNNYKVKHVLQ